MLLSPVPKHIQRSNGFCNLTQPLPFAADCAPDYLPQAVGKLGVGFEKIPRGGTGLTACWGGREKTTPSLLPPGRAEAYCLVVSADAIRIDAADKRGMIHALVALEQLLRRNPGALPCCEICDYPDLSMRGAMICLHQLHDFMPYCGPNFPTVLRMLDVLCEAKLNTLLFEHETFFPWSGRNQVISCREHFTGDQIAQIDREAEKRGIEIIPLVQTLGHVYHILIHRDQYAACAENPEVPQQLCPQSPDARRLVCELIDDVIALHPASSFIHLGGDECEQLGQCPRCREFVEKFGAGKLFIDFYRFVTDFVLSKGRIPILWHDMALRNPELLGELDERVRFQFWNYGRASHGKLALPLRKLLEQVAPERVIGAPGARAERQHGSIHASGPIIAENIREMNQSIHAAACPGSILTDWPDTGIGFFDSWPAIRMQGETTWNTANPRLREFRRNYGAIHFGVDLPELLDKLDLLCGGMHFAAGIQSLKRNDANRYDLAEPDFQAELKEAERDFELCDGEIEMYRLYGRKFSALELAGLMDYALGQCTTTAGRAELEYVRLIARRTAAVAALNLGVLKYCFVRRYLSPLNQWIVEQSGAPDELKYARMQWDELRRELFDFYLPHTARKHLENHLAVILPQSFADGIDALLKELTEH